MANVLHLEIWWSENLLALFQYDSSMISLYSSQEFIPLCQNVFLNGASFVSVCNEIFLIVGDLILLLVNSSQELLLFGQNKVVLDILLIPFNHEYSAKCTPAVVALCLKCLVLAISTDYLIVLEILKKEIDNFFLEVRIAAISIYHVFLLFFILGLLPAFFLKSCTEIALREKSITNFIVQLLYFCFKAFF